MSCFCKAYRSSSPLHCSHLDLTPLRLCGADPAPKLHISFCLNSHASLSLSNSSANHFKEKYNCLSCQDMRRFILRCFDIFILVWPYGRAIGTLFLPVVAHHELARTGHPQRKMGGTKDCCFTATFYTSDGKSRLSLPVIRISIKVWQILKEKE